MVETNNLGNRVPQLVKNPAWQCRDIKDDGSIPGQKDPWRAWRSTPVLMHSETYRQRRLVGYSPQGCTEV